MPHPLERVLGDHRHRGIRACLSECNRAYRSNNEFMLARAQQLLTGGFSQAEAVTMLVTLINEIATEASFTSATGFAVLMKVGNVPVATICDLFRNYAALAIPPDKGPRMVSLARAVRGWTWGSINSLLTSFQVNPRDLNLQQWGVIAGHLANNSHAEAIAFASRLGYNAAGRASLAQLFNGANPNNLTAANWCTLAGRAGNNYPRRTSYFARIAGWNFAAIHQTIQDFANHNPRNLTDVHWTTLAVRMGVNHHARTRAFAAIGYWSAARILALAAHFAHNRHHLEATRWVEIAGHFTANSNISVARTREACAYVGLGWPRTMAFGGPAVRHLRLVSDGVMYGRGNASLLNPHVTIHGINERTSPGAWRRQGAHYHVVVGTGGKNKYDYRGREHAFFQRRVGRRFVDVVLAVNIPAADNIAAQFRQAMGFQ